jgi:hypothetical protein
MTGFESRPMTDPTGRSAVSLPAEIDLGRDTIQSTIARAEQLRSQKIGIWLRRCLTEWRSLWRRPGRAIPKAHRSFKANA